MNFTALRRRGISSEIPRYLMTMESNPQVFQICLDKGWCSAEGMTYEDAAAVTSLGRDFGFNNKNITHFEEFEYFTGVTMLQTNSFRYATNLKSIVFPDSLVRIADYCFNSCGIEEYDTKNVSIIGNDSFPVCDSVKKITIGSALSSIYNPGSSKSLEEIVVDSENEYYETDGEVLIYKPTNALVIATNTVSDIPEGVEVIGSGSMREIHVTTLTLPSTVNSIGQFLYRSSVTNLISKAVVPPTTAANTFNGATITNIYVPDESIEDYKAAPYWDALASKIQPMSLLLPMMTTSTNAEVLSVCYANGWCESPDYMTYAEAKLVDNDMFGTVFRGNTQITHFEEFEYFTGVTEIAQWGLQGMRNLSSIKFPPSLVTIRTYGIQDLSSLKTLFIPQNVAAIGGYQSGLSSLESIIVSDSNQTFDSRDNCNAVIRSSDNVLLIGCKNTTIPNNIVAINTSAFWNMNIFQLDIPSSISSIGTYSLAGNPNLTTIICRATTPPSVSENTFGNGYNAYVGYNTRNQGINRLYVPKGCSANYNTSYWSSILLDSSKCGFTIYELNEDGTIPQE